MVNGPNIDRDRDRLEVYGTIVLAIATLAVAWCSYQSTLWNGIQTFRLAESNKYSRLAQQKLIQSGQNKAMEEGVIINFVDAVLSKDQTKIDYIIGGVRPELANILSNWLQSHPLESASAPRHPMIMPEYEAIMGQRLDESQKMSEKAEETFRTAQVANLNADRYSLFTVLFSLVLFLGAITTKLVRINVRLIITLLSAIICVGGLIVVFFYLPVAHLG
ncbi:MAG: hypothetical protein E6H10_00485 [Bacteroidetes bacterium]|nr:MAG: hypothetical protein E6H10_00485 [Bacteroidota bacterium]